MSQRTNIKQPILTWLDTDGNAKLSPEKGIKKFIKDTGMVDVRPQAFNDYHKHYANGMRPKPMSMNPTQRPEVAASLDDVQINIFNTDDKKRKNKPAKDIFTPYQTKKPVDIILSEPGGVMKGTTFILDGEAGVGKSTVAYDIQQMIHVNYPNAKVICVQSEMKVIDLDYERLKKGWMKNVDFFLLRDKRNVPNLEEGRDIYEYMKLLLEKVFTAGYDFILVDSIEDIIDKLKDYCNMSRGEAESFLLGLFDGANEGDDNKGVKSAIIAINQVTKGGVFVGSNKLKHNTTGFMHLRFDDRGERYAEFSKHRRNGGVVNKKMYFTLNEKGEVVWDEAEFKAMQERSKMLTDEKSRLKDSANNFSKLFARPEGDETVGGRIKSSATVDAEGEFEMDEDDNDE